MAKRKIIKIDETKCNGCGLCIPNCPEGALQIVDGKARLISDLFCDGLGACIGHCPEGAIIIEEREAIAYDERKAMENIVRHGPNTIKAHLEHLRDHNQTKFLHQALDYLKEKGIVNPLSSEGHAGRHGHSGCPGARTFDFRGEEDKSEIAAGPKVKSQLRQWPIQLHLVSPMAPYYQGRDVVLTADCVAYALGSYHADYLKGKAVAIACPKLDEGQDTYIEKIKSWFEDAKIKTLTVMIMEVPCCMGLLELAKRALAQSKRKVPIKYVVVGIQGEILEERQV